MPLKNSFPSIAALVGVLLMELALSSGRLAAQTSPVIPVRATYEISLDFNPPDRGAPQSTTGGASRSLCVRGNAPLTLLVPADKTGQFGLTATARPTFLVYIPRTKAQSAEFLIKDMSGTDPEGQETYRATIAVPLTPGVVELRLPDSAPALESGKDYQWSFSLVCNPKDRLSDVFTNAWISHTQPNSKLATTLKQASLRDRPALYARSSYWYDTLSTLAELRRENPQDAQLGQDWSQLLQSVGLKDVATQPLLPQAPRNPAIAPR